MANDFDVLKELVNETALDKNLNWEQFRYDSMLEIAIMNAYEQYYDIINNEQLNQKDKDLTIISIFAYLLMENTQLHLENMLHE